MTDEQRKELKNEIERLIAELCGSLDSLKEAATPVSPDNAIGRLSRQDAMQAQQLSKNTLARSQKRIPLLEQALRQLETDPEFGLCLSCEEPIPFKRLILIPESKTCVNCA